MAGMVNERSEEDEDLKFNWEINFLYLVILKLIIKNT